MDGLGLGRIVHYVKQVSTHGEPPDVKEFIHERPAIVTKVWDEGMVNLDVFNDGSLDPEPPVVAATSVPYDESGRRRHSWHWPERV